MTTSQPPERISTPAELDDQAARHERARGKAPGYPPLYDHAHGELPRYAYCRACDWTSAVQADVIEDEAAAHVVAAGHEVRCVSTRETILRPAVLAVTA